MARGPADAGGDRGGEGIQAPRPARARLITGAAAVAAHAAVAAYTALDGTTLASAGGVIAAAGAAGLAAAVVLRTPFLVPWTVALTATGYLVGRSPHAVADPWAALVGASLLLAAELAFWSIGHDRRIREDAGLVSRRVRVLAAVVAASALVAFVLLGAAAASSSAGLLATAVGVAAAVSALALLLRLVRG